MHRDLIPCNIKRYQSTISADCYLNLASGRALHEPDHAVLRCPGSGNRPVIDTDNPVALIEPGLLGRSSRNDAQHDGSIIGHIELDANAFEIAGKLGFRFSEFHRRKIYRMRVQFGKSSRDGSICHGIHVDGIHIILLNLLKNEIQFAPTVVIPVECSFRAQNFLAHQCTKHSQDYSQERDGKSIFNTFHISTQSTFSTSIPAFFSRSIPSVIRYSSRYTTLFIPA